MATATSTNYSVDASSRTTKIDPYDDDNTIPSSNTFGNGPSIYPYGFLATLTLVFFVSIAVAWKYVINLSKQNGTLTRFQ
jgi:hypothetical protein